MFSRLLFFITQFIVMSSFYLIVKRGETSLRLGYSAQQVHIIIIILLLLLGRWS